MVGTWRWNLASGVFGFILTFLVSAGRNPTAVSGLRGLYACAAFFAAAFLFRAMLGAVRPASAPEPAGIKAEGLGNPEAKTHLKGSRLDLITPDDGEEWKELLAEHANGGGQAHIERNEAGGGKSGEAEVFKRLDPPQLTTAREQSPEALAEALRKLRE